MPARLEPAPLAGAQPEPTEQDRAEARRALVEALSDTAAWVDAQAA